MQKDPEETQGAASPYHSTVPVFPLPSALPSHWGADEDEWK